ncbi:DUF4189 domain-containing protein [Nocardia sp. NPDC052316]|uniref:DUF4189 domain-containing protein n=1 Tax=Nocardia sp. NPDC052316 TaxID=3364329 RepID=UPI0037CC6E49
MMSLSGKAALRLFAAAAFVAASAGSATAEPNSDGSYYGSKAISVTSGGASVSTAWDYPNWAEADAAALADCRADGATNCTIIVRFVNGCGAIAERDGRYIGGTGATRAEAERAAIAAFGPPPLNFGSSAPNTARIAGTTHCTANAE